MENINENNDEIKVQIKTKMKMGIKIKIKVNLLAEKSIVSWKFLVLFQIIETSMMMKLSYL